MRFIPLREDVPVHLPENFPDRDAWRSAAGCIAIADARATRRRNIWRHRRDTHGKRGVAGTLPTAPYAIAWV
jgi:hypothetical protein